MEKENKIGKALTKEELRKIRKENLKMKKEKEVSPIYEAQVKKFKLGKEEFGEKLIEDKLKRAKELNKEAEKTLKESKKDVEEVKSLFKT